MLLFGRWIVMKSETALSRFESLSCAYVHRKDQAFFREGSCFYS